MLFEALGIVKHETRKLILGKIKYIIDNERLKDF